MTAGARCEPATGSPVRFADALWLAKEEAFEVCTALAAAGASLARDGRVAEAGVLSGLVDRLEGRLTEGYGAGEAASRSPPPAAGSKSRARELMQ